MKLRDYNLCFIYLEQGYYEIEGLYNLSVINLEQGYSFIVLGL